MDSAHWAGRSVFITGHTGFKGAWLCLLLERLGATVHGYALDTPADFLFNRAGIARTIATDVRGDIRDADAVTAAISAVQPEVVLHLAAQSLVRESYRTPRETFSVNVDGTLAVLEAARAVPSVRSVVVVTTDKVYRNDEWAWGYREIDPLGGDDPYSASKAAAELAAHSFAVSFPRDGFAVATARAGNVIGGGDATPDALVPELVTAFREGRAPVIRRPGARRPWQHALEPLSGYLTLAHALLDQRALHDTAWNFGPVAEDGLTVAEFTDELSSRWGEAADWKLDSDAGPHEAGLLMVDSAKARSELAWKPRWRVREAIGAVADWEQAVDRGEDPLTVTRRQIEQYLGGTAPMKITHSGIPGVVVLEPTPIRDNRGFFTRTLDVAVLEEAGIDPYSFKQENQSRSRRGGIRGLHGRIAPGGEAKLARCARGAVLDVVLDARPDSPTFGTVETFVLDDVDHRQVYVPGGCLHGYQVLSEDADFCYRSDVFYGPGEVAVNPLDLDLAVPWREPFGELSERDLASPSWREFARDQLGVEL